MRSPSPPFAAFYSGEPPLPHRALFSISRAAFCWRFKTAAGHSYLPPSFIAPTSACLRRLAFFSTCARFSISCGGRFVTFAAVVGSPWCGLAGRLVGRRCRRGDKCLLPSCGVLSAGRDWRIADTTAPHPLPPTLPFNRASFCCFTCHGTVRGALRDHIWCAVRSFSIRCLLHSKRYWTFGAIVTISTAAASAFCDSRCCGIAAPLYAVLPYAVARFIAAAFHCSNVLAFWL